jgi:hypothetical protein
MKENNVHYISLYNDLQKNNDEIDQKNEVNILDIYYYLLLMMMVDE